MSSDAMPQCDFHATELTLKLNMSIDADVSHISPVVERVMEIVREMQCAAGKEFEVEMALREALANAIIHGARHDASKQVQFCVACDPATGLLIVVRDPGEGFDPYAIPDCCRGQNVFSDHGRGIFLINQLMDEVRFERGGTEIHMRKY
jgi:serine/threonine-protein kinase RsbW